MTIGRILECFEEVEKVNVFDYDYILETRICTTHSDFITTEISLEFSEFMEKLFIYIGGYFSGTTLEDCVCQISNDLNELYNEESSILFSHDYSDGCNIYKYIKACRKDRN